MLCFTILAVGLGGGVGKMMIAFEYALLWLPLLSVQLAR